MTTTTIAVVYHILDRAPKCKVVSSQQIGTRPGQGSRSKGRKPYFQSLAQTSMSTGILGLPIIHCLRRLIRSREQRDQTSCYGLVLLLLWD
ncbi:uncharacterized protein LOC114274838 isoform X5 [Camellia sinensis]|uniref:uncharacterized protein LOC114274838 isoform X5 n=1 Tax=Camellia sinensis TaxID=4442 RepID=UPI0010365700|nr:uncharacterized protein LOC114274838 isoform X5 [Camellia sinensis]